ncbi:unnamed protein product [Oncorhynchus mykiss]|uniref:G-protein coupled receptors family 2 profile 1 domain-containing protein n=1 Tax=Oncorhynchus mykiss TaxID=8022 RepID=A0A060Y6I8_ONCMY|nr:unnamed protein product [Oncorhynchus mykiss]
MPLVVKLLTPPPLALPHPSRQRPSSHSQPITSLHKTRGGGGGQQAPQTGKTTGRRGSPCITLYKSSFEASASERWAWGLPAEQQNSYSDAQLPAALIAVHGTWDEWSPWSLCSSTCGRGYRDRTRSCKPPQFGGDPCMGPEKQTKFCNIAVCPVDGVWNEWANWGSCSASCSNGTMQRIRECNGPSYGGSECRGEWIETRDCFLRECPVEGKWHPWTSWVAAPRHKGVGTVQERETQCGFTTYIQKPLVCPPKIKVCRRCQLLYWIQPHEICAEENFSNVVWKMTPAGDTAAVRCPPNANGLILRRCTLDDEGIAYWENPTYMKCISNDYRSIQTLTREHLSKAQRGLVGDGVSEVMTKLRVTSSDGTSYSGDLLAIVDVLKNMTEIFRRAYNSPSNADMRNFVQSVSNLLMEENRERWEEAQLVSWSLSLILTDSLALLYAHT